MCNGSELTKTLIRRLTKSLLVHSTLNLYIIGFQFVLWAIFQTWVFYTNYIYAVNLLLQHTVEFKCPFCKLLSAWSQRKLIALQIQKPAICQYHIINKQHL